MEHNRGGFNKQTWCQFVNFKLGSTETEIIMTLLGKSKSRRLEILPMRLTIKIESSITLELTKAETVNFIGDERETKYLSLIKIK